MSTYINYVLEINPRSGVRVGEDLFPICRLPFYLIVIMLSLAEVFQSQEVTLITCFSQCLCYWYYIQEVVSCHIAFKATYHFLLYLV